MKKAYRAVVFDLDGTLLNTLEDLKEAVNHTMSAMNYPPRSLKEVRSFVGNGIKKLIERSLPPHCGEEEFARAYALFCTYYAAHSADHTLPYAGLPAVIQRGKEAGMGMAVVSNKAEEAARVLCERFYAGAFFPVIGAREGLAKKPASDGVLAALEGLGVEKKDALYVGDSDVDYYTAQNAGMDCALVTWGFRERSELEQLHPRYLVDKPEALEKILLG